MRFVSTSAVTAIFMVVGASGCADNPEDRVRMSPSTVTDRASRTVGLPLQAYRPSYDESRTIDLAESIRTRECMAGAGYAWRIVDRTSEPQPASRRYGLWSYRDAKQSAYSPPADSELERTQERESRARRLPQEARQRAQCIGRSRIGDLPSVLQSEVVAFGIFHRVLASPDARRVIRDWRDCLRVQDMEVPQRRHGLFTLTSGTGPRSRKIALSDVRCKEQTLLVERLAHLEASAQRAWLSKHAPQLEDDQRTVDTAVRKAERIVAEWRQDQSPRSRG